MILRQFSVAKIVCEKKKVRAGLVWQNVWAVVHIKGHFFGGTVPDLWCYNLNFPSTKSSRLLRACTDWLNDWYFWPDELTDRLTIWAAAAGGKSPFSSPQTRHEVRNNIEVSHPLFFTNAEACSKMYALCRDTHITGGLSLLWHNQQSTLWPPTKVKAVIIDMTVTWASNLTVQSHFSMSQTASIHFICLSPRLRGVLLNNLLWPFCLHHVKHFLSFVCPTGLQ